MGYTIPGWLDEVLEFIGINFPNVDEDDYREMADAMREFAEQFEGHGAEAHKAFSRILSSSEGWAVEGMEKHWNQVKAGHLEKLPELARLFADACDTLAEIVFWMKTKAEAELAVMAGTVGLSIGLAWVTGGLSAVLGAAEIAAMRQVVKRIVDEAVDRIVDEVIAKVTEPVNAKLEAMVEDMVLDLAEGAFSMPPADGSGGGHGGGKHGGMQLASAGDSGSSGGGKVTRIDHVEFEDGAGKVSRHGSDLHTAASSPLGRVKGAFGRSKGRDPFTQAFDSVLHGAIKGSEKAGGDLSEVTSFSDTDALRFTYDDEHRVTSWTDRNGHTYAYVYDAAGRVVETVGPDGALSSRFAYDSAERVTRFTDSTGAVTVTRLNALGQTVAETDPLGHTVHFAWDRHDNLLERTDQLGHTARFTWDERGNLTGIRFPDGTGSTTRYNDLNLPEEVTGADGATWRQTYDERGNRTRITAPDGTETHFSYDARGALLTLTDPTGASEHLTHDAAGLVLSRTDALGRTASVERDAFGRPVRAVAPGGATTLLRWLPQGWLARRVAPDGAEERWTWDAEGNCTSHTDATGAVTRFEYTHFDRLAARTGADGARYSFAYDTELRLTEVVNPQGMSWSYTYDAVGNLTAESDFDGRTVAYALDPTGQPVARTTPLGVRITSEYDVMGRVTAKDVAGRYTRYTYDTAGRVSSLTSPTSTLTLERDRVGRVVAETVDGRTTRFAYDAAGRRTTRTTPTGAVARSTYDAVGNRTALLSDGHALTFTHDAWGKELTRSFGPAEAPVTLTSGWNDMGRLTSQLLTGGGRTLRARAYDYRADGCLERISDELRGTSRSFDLDPVGRPLRVTAENWSESYAYDSAGNEVSAQWPDQAARTEGRGERTYEGTRVLTAGRIRYEYDAAGRTTLRQKTRLSKKPDTWRYSWDEENRLVACVTPDGTRWTYSYDPLGRRTAKHRMADDGRTVVQSVHFTWDGTRLAEQTDTAHHITTTWEYEGHRPLTQLERRINPAPEPQREVDARFFAIVTDLVGAPSELVDEQGTIAWHGRSTVWGATGWNRDAAAYTPLRLPGQYDDVETGFYYNYQRHYDPDTARYASPDPLGLGPAPNPVAYVTNPHTRMDPEGLIAKGCTENGGWYSGLKPANLLDSNKQRVNPVDQEINHIPAKASYSHLDQAGFRTDKNGGGAGMGPAIRMDAADHRDLTSTGSSKESEQWRQDQRQLIDAGRWDEAMKMDIDEIRELYGDKYDTHIKDMIDSLQNNRKFQAMMDEKGWTINYDILK